LKTLLLEGQSSGTPKTKRVSRMPAIWLGIDRKVEE
jgi:hypothetical protein